MGRHKTTPHTDEERAELYEKYIRPNHKLVRKNVARFTSKKSEIKDNFQDMCLILLRGIDTYSPTMDIGNWIISCCRREIGRLDAKKPTYVDARKGSEFEYSTPHHGYKAKHRRKKDKDFVNVYDDSVFKQDPNEMFFGGVSDSVIRVLQRVSPNLDFQSGTFADIEYAILNGDDRDLIAHFRKFFYCEKIRDIAYSMGMTESEVKSCLNRISSRIDKAKDECRKV